MKSINDKLIKTVVDQIVYNFSPQKIILFSSKQDLVGETISFKLCVILDSEDKFSVERDIYINTDSEIPFDIVVYTQKEYANLINNETSFANKINNMGIVVYE